MRLILDNVSERDYEWLVSMAKSLKFKVAIEGDGSNFGIKKAHEKEFLQRKEDYLSGKDQTTPWDTIKQGYGLV